MIGQVNIPTKPRSAAGLAVAACVFLLGATGAVRSQDIQEFEKPKHDVKVTLKLIQVYVADEDGNPVTDLAKEDFTLLDNGLEMTLTEFERHVLGSSGKDRAGAREASDPDARPDPLLNRKFFFLFDARNSTPYGFGTARKAALEFLETKIKSRDEVAVLSYTDIAGFKVHEYLTTNHGRVRDVVAELAEIIGPSFIGYIKPIDDGDAEAERDAQWAVEAGRRGGTEGSQPPAPLLNPVSRASSQGTPFVIERTAVGQEAESVAAKHPDFPLGLQMIAKALNNIPGTKNILLFSDGYPRRMVIDDQSRFSGMLQDAGHELAAASSRVFAINTEGSRAAAKPAALRGDLSLQKLSSATGGQYFRNVARYGDITEAIQKVTENYYVLGYYINDAWDGRFHEIKVTTLRPGCVVSAPAGFSNSKPFSEYSTIEKEIQLYDLALSDRSYFQEPVTVPLVVLPCSCGSQSTLLILSRISLDDLEDVAVGLTEVFYIVRDSNLRIIEAKRAEIDFSEAASAPFFQYGMTTIGPGQYECRMVLRNLETGRGAVAKTTVEVAEPDEPGFHLLPPLLFLSPNGKSVQYIHIGPQTDEKGGGLPSSLKDFYPLTVNELQPIVDTVPADAPSLVFEFRCLAGDAVRDPLKVTACLVDPTGNETPLPFKLMGRKIVDGAIVCLAEADLPHLERGDHALRIGVLNRRTNRSTVADRPFEVR